MHLKRFTPMGRKLTHFIDYEERLALKPYMSDGSFGPSYSLYGVICHAGGGPNSGHYFSYVKDCRGQWHEMNDESVTKVPHAPLKQKNAYILFYLRDRGQGLDAAVNLPPSAMVPRQSIAKNMKKRKASEDGHEDEGVKVTKPFIGPRMPSPDRISTPKKTAEKPNATPAKADPQAERVRQKIEAAQTSKALDGLEAYGSDSSDKEDDGPEELANPKTVVGVQPPPTGTSPLPPSSPLPTSATTPSRSSTTDSNAANSVRTPISTTSFYGGPSSSHKRKHSESFGKERRSSAASFNPFDKSRLTNGRKKPRPL
ncbi:unnamed protein product [Mycena citricolor]|uniref:ubiquitinyl hydrolase 1 n=1 Tax=Mycena citricolor TaxID=2018698 RepID=A0AAD2HES7_9AGAR|nr:unnamed protein product [Mycena citricolor]